MNRYGLTSREKAIWPTKKQIDGFSFMEKCFWFALFCVLASLVIHLTIEPKANAPIVKNSVGMLSDRQQETLYCKEALNGYPVKGATLEALQAHCAKYI